jgi:hypothetical protein
MIDLTSDDGQDVRMESPEKAPHKQIWTELPLPQMLEPQSHPTPRGLMTDPSLQLVKSALKRVSFQHENVEEDDYTDFRQDFPSHTDFTENEAADLFTASDSGYV